MIKPPSELIIDFGIFDIPLMLISTILKCWKHIIFTFLGLIVIHINKKTKKSIFCYIYIIITIAIIIYLCIAIFIIPIKRQNTTNYYENKIIEETNEINSSLSEQNYPKFPPYYNTWDKWLFFCVEENLTEAIIDGSDMDSVLEIYDNILLYAKENNIMLMQSDSENRHDPTTITKYEIKKINSDYTETVKWDGIDHDFSITSLTDHNYILVTIYLSNDSVEWNLVSCNNIIQDTKIDKKTVRKLRKKRIKEILLFSSIDEKLYSIFDKSYE